MVHQARHYLDYNASAPLLDCARESMIEALNTFGNASSVHFEGRDARKTIEKARASFAALIGFKASNIIFTSGATEAANHVLSPLIRAGGHMLNVSKLYIGATEHPCVMQGGRFSKEQIEILPTDKNGILDLLHLEAMLAKHEGDKGHPMVAVQYANNETGVIQPVKEISEVIHKYDGFLMVDAVQALGKIEISVEETSADFLIFSSHKIGGPQGVGALVLRDASLSPMPILEGGGQESYHRGGTENVAAIAGFGAACEWHQENLTKNIKIFSLRDSIEEQIDTISKEIGNHVARPVFFGKGQKRLGNTSCFAVSGIKSETALMALDLDGVSVSSGSACSSGKVKRSHVLEAMDASQEEMEGAVRLSLGWEEDKLGAERFLAAWKTIISRVAA